jgi:DNA-binding transcriptional MerR regulator
VTRERITIGALARRSGLPVKTLRFYADEGLLPPVGRTSGGYRVFSEDAPARLDLIRTLREAGLGIAAIRAILARDLPLAAALRVRLGAVEAHIASLQQVAAALRAALRGEPNEDDIRRLCAVTRLTTEERKQVVQTFVERVAEAAAEPSRREIMRANAPRLPDEPTPQQLDAWIELAELVRDERFVADMRASAAQAWGGELDHAAQQRVHAEASAAARALIERGVAPTDDAAREVAARLVAGLAAAMGRPDDAAFRAELRAMNASRDPRVVRYWQLVAVLSGQELPAGPAEEWYWLSAAIDRHVLQV